MNVAYQSICHVNTVRGMASSSFKFHIKPQSSTFAIHATIRYRHPRCTTNVANNIKSIDSSNGEHQPVCCVFVDRNFYDTMLLVYLPR